MKYRLVFSVGLAVLAGVSFVTPAMAVVTVDWVTVGNAGNAADTRVMETDPTTGYGAVGYEYRIARNETTIGQYAEFLNAVAKTDTYELYISVMTMSHVNGISQSGSSGSYSYAVASGSADKPITFVTWFDAARFCNWLHNGQPEGAQTVATTEDGAYTLNGATSGVGITKNVGATVWIPTENEWYKAAYYDPNKGGAGVGGYWLHANQSNSMTTNSIGVAGAANFYDGDYVGSGTSSFPSGSALTNVGAYGANSDSFYGTNDQGGNVFEWNDAVIYGSSRVMRGGSYGFLEVGLRSSYRDYLDPSIEGGGIGFRVASVPEPGAMVVTMMFSGLLLIRRKR